MNKKTVNLSLPVELLKKVDVAAKREYSSRSDFVRKSLLNQLQIQEIDSEYQDFVSIYGKSLKNLSKNDSTVNNKELLNAANSIIKHHKQDFINLAKK
jgi:metal-responsive CopG/Arc/MetJ family transcriptional regulator